ncbi:head-to-tail connector complex protein [Gordonia phage Schmidt]|uniref:Head-to-tail connector complex protein n=1 Tax=Gordonia phage Schmidt TaxID=2301697 RepID=A0A385E075_9CAUD|nr:head-to-tail connector complex protein [Gordonia phage Schmidt]AXQ65136.1 head-to-tail connector complex protein [Gordonia phage Schmidt]
MAATLDPLAELIAVVHEGGWSVGHEMPVDEPWQLPRVQVLGLPGTPTFEAWGGRTLGRAVPHDVIVWANEDHVAAAVARDVAAWVEGVHGRVIVTLDNLPHEVSDPNPQLRRWQFTATVSWRV